MTAPRYPAVAVNLDPTADVLLDPELKAHVEALEHSTALVHPLVMCEPYADVGALNRHLNEMLEHKRARVADALAKRDFDRYLLLHERPYRLQAFIEYEYRYCPAPRSYWPALAWVWLDDGDANRCSPIYEALFTRPYPDRHLLMEPPEGRAFAGLPKRVTVYRGAPPEYRTGLSWTTDPNVAYFFATRWDDENPIYTAEVDKRDCLAYFTRRGEGELIVHPRAWAEPVVYCETEGLSQRERGRFEPEDTENRLDALTLDFYARLDEALEPEDRAGY